MDRGWLRWSGFLCFFNLYDKDFDLLAREQQILLRYTDDGSSDWKHVHLLTLRTPTVCIDIMLENLSKNAWEI